MKKDKTNALDKLSFREDVVADTPAKRKIVAIRFLTQKADEKKAARNLALSCSVAFFAFWVICMLIIWRSTSTLTTIEFLVLAIFSALGLGWNVADARNQHRQYKRWSLVIEDPEAQKHAYEAFCHYGDYMVDMLAVMFRMSDLRHEQEADKKNEKAKKKLGN